MTTIIPTGFAQCALAMTLTGDPEPILLTWGISLTGAVSQANVNTLFDLCLATPGIRTEVSSSYAFTGLRVYEGNGADLPPTVWESNVAGANGLGAGAPLPQNCAVLAVKRTASAGRQNKGRWYIPGIGEGAVDAAGNIAGATVTAFQTAVNNTFTNISNAGLVDEMVIIHSKPKVGPTPSPTVVTAMVVSAKMATQRRRLRK